MELETINKLYLELGQIATAKDAYTMQMENLIRSFSGITDRKGKNTNWKSVSKAISDLGLRPDDD